MYGVASAGNRDAARKERSLVSMRIGLLVILATAFALCGPSAARGSPEPIVIALGDSITYGFGLSSPATQNYAKLYARRISGTLVDLAVPGYTCADVFHAEVPKMKPGASIVILNCGTNDVGGFGLSGSLPDGSKRVPGRVRRRLARRRESLRTRSPADSRARDHSDRLPRQPAPLATNDRPRSAAVLKGRKAVELDACCHGRASRRTSAATRGCTSQPTFNPTSFTRTKRGMKQLPPTSERHKSRTPISAYPCDISKNHFGQEH